MSGSKAQLRSQALAIRVATLRAHGMTLTETAHLAGVARQRVRTLQLLGQRLIEAGL